MSRALMIQGTGSNVGKSMLVAGLCRAAKRRGFSVAPFKPQNMSNNAAVTSDGGEIGRAQALQAMACGKPLITDMNPVLLKPETDVGSQVVVQGKRLTTIKAREYAALKPTLMEKVLESFNRLKSNNDLVIVEGAGSPAEVNLRPGDIANMGFAEAANVPVILAGDIDRGGVIAQIVGTQAVVSKEDSGRIVGFMVNKFRGDPSLFDDGYAMIKQHTGWPGFGVLPYFPEAWRLPAEDALDISDAKGTGVLKVVCLGLSRIANFDDLDPLAQEPDVSLTMLRAGQPIPGDTDMVIIPGSKSTRGDLAFLREQGWDIDLYAHVRRGGHVLGICGGYQMLGRNISDPEGIEGAPGDTSGLGLLDVETLMTPDKRLTETQAVHASTNTAFHGYEIHIGRTEGADRARPFALVGNREEGALSADERIAGSYLHGMFRDDAFRAAWLSGLGAEAAKGGYDSTVEATLEALADHMEAHLDVDGLLKQAC
ncbi:adenosylcobyric acid synthase (glutamine-hydrolysing) [Shimia gijangensis]|uniref:Cobyric acid synthase n=1 Tax=Shimia gijangensis TaxID=1470563 RepID=A0A1M6LLL9_9RHOB|nr:cobyric acid synthase [Shimia gijangensis]SHJ72141.1 adenosylcobyric acid synthase (glutamine-hydrolysing) [Shimia gijangensis]